ncbi:MAG: hypothetical protein WDN48_20585 [Pseudolabrys sp.]
MPLASVKAAFNARHNGVSGLARMAHDLLLRSYLETDESHELVVVLRAEKEAGYDQVRTLIDAGRF